MSQLYYRIGLLVVLEYVLNMARVNSTRLIIKATFGGDELPAHIWFRPSTILGLTMPQFIGLAAIASFTLLTFPLGIWIGSFKLGISLPISSMIAYAASALTFPLNAFIMHRYVGEFSINSTTITGIVVTVASQLVAILGWYIILEGNTRGGI